MRSWVQSSIPLIKKRKKEKCKLQIARILYHFLEYCIYRTYEFMAHQLSFNPRFYKAEHSTACSVNPTLHRTDTGTYAAKAPRQGLNKENGP